MCFSHLFPPSHPPAPLQFKIPENLARFAVKHGMWGFVRKLSSETPKFIEARRKRCEPYSPDPQVGLLVGLLHCVLLSRCRLAFCSSWASVHRCIEHLHQLLQHSRAPLPMHVPSPACARTC